MNKLLKNLLFLFVLSGSSLAGDDAKISVIELKWKVASEMVSIIEPLLSSDGTVVAEPRTNKLIIWDNTAKVWDIERTLARLDINDLDNPSKSKKSDLLLEGILKDAKGNILSIFSLRTPPGFEAMHQEIDEIPYKALRDAEKFLFAQSGLKIWLKPDITMDDGYALRTKLWTGELGGNDLEGKPIIIEYSGMVGGKYSLGETKKLEFMDDGKIKYICDLTLKPFRA